MAEALLHVDLDQVRVIGDVALTDVGDVCAELGVEPVGLAFIGGQHWLIVRRAIEDVGEAVHGDH